MNTQGEIQSGEGQQYVLGYCPLNRDPFLENTLNSRAFQAVYTKHVLLGDKTDMEEIAAAVRKLRQHAEALKKTSPAALAQWPAVVNLALYGRLCAC